MLIRFGSATADGLHFGMKPKKVVGESMPKETLSYRRNKKQLCLFG